jgi:uncharacterized protein
MTNYPSAYIDYLVYFHGDRDYFECHEVLEEYWKEHPGDPLSGIYVGLIQVAVALYHQRRGNRNGAVKMLKQAIRGLHNPLVEQLGINGEQLQARLKQRLEELETSPELPYTDLDLCLSDAELTERCSRIASGRGKTWGQPSDLGDRYLLNKHTLRDRSEVIRERERQKQRKQQIKIKRDE